MGVFRKREGELERRLRASRPKPPPGLIDAVVMRMEGRGARGRRLHGRRIAVAAAMTAVGLAVFGAFGGLSYAAEAISQATGVPIVKTSSGAAQRGGDRPPGSVQQPRPRPHQGQYGRTTVICHRTGNTGKIPHPPFVLIRVPDQALPAHKAHGDTLPNPGHSPICPGPPIP